MRKFLQGLGLSALVMLPVMAGAVPSYDDPDYTYDYGNNSIDTAVDNDSIAVLGGIGFLTLGLVIGLISLVISLAGFVFWLMMFIDCIKRDFDQKILWIVLMLVFGFIPAVLYYFMIKKKNVTGTTHKTVVASTATTTTVTTPPATDNK